MVFIFRYETLSNIYFLISYFMLSKKKYALYLLALFCSKDILCFLSFFFFFSSYSFVYVLLQLACTHIHIHMLKKKRERDLCANV